MYRPIAGPACSQSPCQAHEESRPADSFLACTQFVWQSSGPSCFTGDNTYTLMSFAGYDTYAVGSCADNAAWGTLRRVLVQVLALYNTVLSLCCSLTICSGNVRLDLLQLLLYQLYLKLRIESGDRILYKYSYSTSSRVHIARRRCHVDCGLYKFSTRYCT